MTNALAEPAQNMNDTRNPLISNLESNLERGLPLSFPDYEEGLITIFTGMRGASKSCQLSRIAMMAMSCWRRPVFSDTPIGGYVMDKRYEVEPLPNEYFVTYGRNIPRGSVIIADEIGEFFNRQEWFTVESRLGTSMFGQIRKLDHWIFGALQFFHHLNTGVAEQVDVLVRCKDLAKTPWGRERHLRRGTESLLEYFDLSGWVSPNGKSARNPMHPQLITGLPYKKEVVYVRAYHKFFDTRLLVGLERKFQTFKIKKEVHKINPRGEAKGELTGWLANTINEAKAKGSELIKAGDIYASAHANGFAVSHMEIKNKLNALGITGRHFSAHPEGAGIYYEVKEVQAP
jgi:hypothetical protein